MLSKYVLYIFVVIYCQNSKTKFFPFLIIIKITWKRKIQFIYILNFQTIHFISISISIKNIKSVIFVVFEVTFFF